MKSTIKSTYEIAPGMNLEEMQALFFDEGALLEAPQQVYRMQAGEKRYYYTFDEKQMPIFYTSVTTMIGQTMPDVSGALMKWYTDNFSSYQEARAYVQERADYGTFMHAEISALAISRKCDTDTLRDRMKSFIEKERLPANFINYENDIKSDIFAFAQFMIDYDVKPLAVEVVLAHPDGYAGAVDMVCEMNFNKGRVMAIIDFKSGRKGFYDSNVAQLFAYKNLWDHNYSAHPVTHLFNWSPKNWRKSPTYNLKNQTASPIGAKVPLLINLMGVDRTFNDSGTVTLMQGEIDLEKGLNRNLSEITFEQLVKERKNERKN